MHQAYLKHLTVTRAKNGTQQRPNAVILSHLSEAWSTSMKLNRITITHEIDAPNWRCAVVQPLLTITE